MKGSTIFITSGSWPNAFPFILVLAFISLFNERPKLHFQISCKKIKGLLVKHGVLEAITGLSRAYFRVFNVKTAFLCACLLGLTALSAQTQLGADINSEAAGDWFGGSVSLSADGLTVAIGAPINDGKGLNSGHVRVYKFISGTWTQQGADIDGEAAGDQSGWSVSLSADGLTVAIGALNNDGNGSSSGHVRVYKFISGTWTQQGSDIDGEAAGDESGASVSLSADGLTVAIGAQKNDGNGMNAGHVRVYQLISGTWTQQGADIDGEAAGDESGFPVSLSADGLTVAIGAQKNDGNGTDAGHVRVYKLISGTWTQQGADIDGEAAGDQSGTSVSLSSDGLTLAVGAYFNDGNGTDAGHVRVYKLISGTWAQQGADINGEAASDLSGISVSLSSNGLTVAIGAPYNDDSGSYAGHVRVYQLISGIWTQQGADINGEAAGDWSGYSVSLSADGLTVAIGAPFNNGNGSDAGHVRVYRIPCPATGSIWYVDAAAASGGNGTSWACAFQNLQNAIDAASSGHEIWVKAGTYLPTAYPSGCLGCTTDRDKAFHLKNGVKVYGGFAGTEALLSERNWTANVTTLSGDFNGDDAGFMNNTENAHHIVLSVADGSNTELDGFTVRGGNASTLSHNITVEGTAISGNVGAGMIISKNSSATVRHCNFVYNNAGLSGYGGGAGMQVIGNGSPAISNCTFSNGTGVLGGGVLIGGASPIFTNCVFSGNSTTNLGGAIYNVNATSSTFVNCLFSGNSSSNGGAMFNTSTVLSLTNCTFSGNRADAASGGALYNSLVTADLKNCLIWNNREGSTTGSATASIYNSGSTLTITYSLIQNHNPSGTGNLNGIPNAADPNYPAFVASLDPATAPSTAGDFHLANCSPLLNLGTNTGVPSTDLFGNARPFGTNVDMGVHELQAAPEAVPPSITCPSNTTVLETGGSYTLANFTASATATDNCGVPTKTQAPVAGTNLNVGNHTVTITATDRAGNTMTCTFAVAVQSNCPATGSIWYVDAAAAIGGNGTSWACAFQNVQDAIDAASSGHEIWVKAGTYLPTKDPFGNATPIEPRDKTFYLKDGVALYGGFAGTEALRTQRNWTANPTILSGDILTAGDNSDNAYHVVMLYNCGTSTKFDGFSLVGGNANGDGFITISGIQVTRNRGGGMYQISSSPNVDNCTFSNNSAASAGGGMLVAYGASAPTLQNCVFSYNSTSTTGAGGGIAFAGSPNLTLLNCTFSNNSANWGGGMYIISTNVLLITGCTFSGNSADLGGGVNVTSTGVAPVFTNCVFKGNSATNAGGGVYNGTSGPILKNCLLTGNVAVNGGGMRNSGSYPTLVNCAISGNTSTGTEGGGFANISGSLPTLTNCVIWNNRSNGTTGSALASMSNKTGSNTTIQYSLIQGHNPSGMGNLNGIPNAADPNYPAFVAPLDPVTAPSTAGDFHIGTCSPLINAGTNTGAPTTDLFGNARPFGSAVDMGVHEWQSPSGTPTAANAGSDQTGGSTCGLTTVTLAANTPTVGTGAWSVVNGTGGSFGDATSPTSAFSGTAGSTYTLRWTVSNSPCAASTDDVDIIFNQNLTTASAGPDQTGSSTCGLTTVTLAANTPTVGTGAWSVVGGTGGSFGDANSPTSSFSGNAGATYTLRWTISNAPCAASTDDVAVAFNQSPSFGTCPGTMTVNAGSGCAATALYNASVASSVPAATLSYSFSGATSGSGSGTGSGSTFNLGTTLVTFTATNSCGTNTCTFNVVVQTGEINVLGNSMTIADDDTTPSTADHTDFGQTTGGHVVRTFTVQNTGAAPLAVTDIALGGANANQFSVGALNPVSPIPAGQSATFTVTYAPNTTGVHNATVTIANGDCDEGTYDFAVRGELTCSAPTFTACPTATVELNTPSNGCVAIANYTASANGLPTPVLTYALTGATTGSGNGTGSGGSFNKGTTTVTVTATNPCTATACTFSVRVTDNVPPSIVCPANMVRPTAIGQCAAQVTFTNPTASDNCAPPTPKGLRYIHIFLAVI